MHQARTPRGRVRGTVVIAVFFILFSFIPTTGSARGTVAQGGSTAVLRMSDEGGNALPSLEPPMVEPDSIMIIGLLFGGLVGLDQSLHVMPDGADSWSISADGRVYTLHIRSGLRLGDGTPVTADDF